MRRLLLAILCLLTLLATGCEKEQDVTRDPKYGNFATVTGQWKTKQPLVLVQTNSHIPWQIFTKQYYDDYLTASTKPLATLPPGTAIQVEYMMRYPSFEADTFAWTGTLVTGPYAGRPLELYQKLFTYTSSPANSGAIYGPWQVDPAQLGK